MHYKIKQMYNSQQFQDSEMRTIKAYEQWYECLQEISSMIEPYVGDDI